MIHVKNLAVASLTFAYVFLQGCERASPIDVAAAPTAGEISKAYDASSLVEVRELNNLPEELQPLLHFDMGGEGPNGRARKFILGGAGNSSALVAYEEFGYVGNFVAEEFVKIGSKWYSVGAWRIGEPNNLSELKEMATFASNHAP
jgi:hypothetical protein